MPIYHVLHSIPLPTAQKSSLAQAITKIHSERFTTPANFVQVDFREISSDTFYIGGKPHAGNHIHANVRTGPSRSQAEWDALCRELQDAWESIFGKEKAPWPEDFAQPHKQLRSVIILGGMTAGLEAGFVLPQAGGDVVWMRENWEEFNRRAEAGDTEMKEMVEEIKVRGLMEGEQGALKNAAKKLEDMLGWGDSA